MPHDQEPEPYHTSVLTGDGWVHELLGGHPERIRNELGMHRHVFAELLAELQSMGHTDSENVSLEEQVAIFLYTCVTGLTIRHVGERFQRSNAIISHCFKKILFALFTPPFYTAYMRLPTGRDRAPRKFRHNPKFWPFFKDCLGVLDGIHIRSSLHTDDLPDWRNRKGFVSQNCLFGCSFDVTFVYSLGGWEGSETDARVYEAARSTDLEIPEGKYYLADAGYPLSNELLVPYRGVQYRDLAEFGCSWERPTNKEELFNLRHASARKVIERILGALKRRFRILQLAPEYAIKTQACIPAALCALHNFILKYDPSEGPLPGRAANDYYDYYDDDNFTGVEPEEASAKRDQIAEMMWQSYQQTLEEMDLGSDESLRSVDSYDSYEYDDDD